MEEKEPVWLPHLTENLITASHGWNLTSYLIALEGWKKGLELRWYSSQIGSGDFSLTSDQKSLFFTKSLTINENIGEFDPDPADVFSTRELLLQRGFSIPEQKRLILTNRDLDEIADHAVRIGFPVRVALNIPADDKSNQAIVNNEHELNNFLATVNRTNLPTKLIIEKVCSSRNYRLFVLGDKVISAIEIKRPCIMGDGTKTIADLIRIKNEIRKKHPLLKDFLIPIDNVLTEKLKEDGQSLNTVPVKGKKIHLSNYSYLYTGGETEEVSGKIDNEVIEAALKAVKIYPEVNYGCVDVLQSGNEIMIRDILFDELEVMLFPVEGKAKDIPAAIINHHFHESKKSNDEKINFYFEMETVSEALTSGNIQSARVMKVPTGEIYGRKFTVHGEVHELRFHQWLKKQAFQLGVHGFLVDKGKNTIEIAVAGKTLEIIGRFKNLLSDFRENTQITEIIEEDLTGQLKAGFEIENEAVRAAEEIEKIDKELQHLEKEIRLGERKYHQYQQSLSWRVTLPLRAVIDNMKYLKRTLKGINK